MLNKPTVFVPSLTGVRGIAALWVVLYHLCQRSDPFLLNIPALYHDQLVARGWCAVDLFFVLSGFILMHAHAAEFRHPSTITIARFAKLRFMRVYPLSWVVLLATVAAFALDPSYRDNLMGWALKGEPGTAFLRTALLGTMWLPGNSTWVEPFWSLSAEVVGYAAFPALAFALVRANRFWPLVAVAALCLTALAVYQVEAGLVSINDISKSGALIRMSCCFAAGAVLAQARRLTPQLVSSWAPALSVVAVAGTILCSMSWKGALLQPACSALLIYSVSFGRGPVDAILRSKPMLFLGRVSFPLYLVHVQLLKAIQSHVEPLQPNTTTAFVLAAGYIAVSLLLAWILHEVVERPAHHLGRTWTRTRSERLVTELRAT